MPGKKNDDPPEGPYPRMETDNSDIILMGDTIKDLCGGRGALGKH